MSQMSMPPVVRAVGYYITFFGGLAITSLSAGFIAAGWSLDQYPVWLKILMGAWPAWSAAFGLTAASHTPVKEEVVQPSERFPGYVPERVLVEEKIANDRDFQRVADQIEVDPEPTRTLRDEDDFVHTQRHEPTRYIGGRPVSQEEFDQHVEKVFETNQDEMTDPTGSSFFDDDAERAKE